MRKGKWKRKGRTMSPEGLADLKAYHEETRGPSWRMYVFVAASILTFFGTGLWLIIVALFITLLGVWSFYRERDLEKRFAAWERGERA